MSPRRWAWLSLVATSFVGAGAIAVACSSFTSTDDTVPQDGAAAEESASDAAITTDTSEPVDASDADVTTRFCAQQLATVLLCDDFEENDGGLRGSWQLLTDGGTIAAADAPMRSGHAVKISTSGEGPSIMLHFDFNAAAAVAGVVFETDVLLDTFGYDYAELVHLQMANATAVYVGGLAKGGANFGPPYQPFDGPPVPIGTAWHHLRTELARGADAGFSQTVTLDSTVLQQTSMDLSTLSSAWIDLGVLLANTGVGTPIAVLYFDNVLLRPK